MVGGGRKRGHPHCLIQALQIKKVLPLTPMGISSGPFFSSMGTESSLFCAVKSPRDPKRRGLGKSEDGLLVVRGLGSTDNRKNPLPLASSSSLCGPTASG